MQRREFLSHSLAATALALPAVAQEQVVAPATEDAPVAKSVLAGSPVISGPDPAHLALLQPVNGPATGFVEYAAGDEPFRTLQAESAGLLPYADHVLKFRFPSLPGGTPIKYRVTATPINFRNAYSITRGDTVTSPEYAFRTLDAAATETRFAIWNDTHENLPTITAIHAATARFRPDFLLWNGDQSNDIYAPAKMTNQYLAPGGLAVAAEWPLAFARGNHDVRGPAARHLIDFTGTPGDRFYYAFRSGPLAALVMDTGEDKVDEHPVFGGLAAFAAMRERQRLWLAETIEQPWFKSAPYRLLFCHIPLYWTRVSPPEGPWWSSDVCRDAWLPLLQQAGVQLIVSGHTHDAKWLPATPNQPIGQLIGGGPKPQAATYITGHATRDNLTLVMNKLDGTVLHTVEIPPA